MATSTGARTAVTSVVGSVGASGSSLVAMVCCVGPGLYSVIGAGGVLAAARIAPWRPWLLAASALFLGLGFWSVYRRRSPADGQACPARAPRWTRITLWTAAIFTVAATLIPELVGLVG